VPYRSVLKNMIYAALTRPAGKEAGAPTRWL
jgi:hypothetical protein